MLQRHGLLRSSRAIQAYGLVDRSDFVAEEPYMDAAAVMGYGAQVSAPHVHAASLELLAEKMELFEDQSRAKSHFESGLRFI